MVSKTIHKKRMGIFTRHLTLSLWSIVCLFPILWVFMNAFKDNKQIFGGPFRFPDPLILGNFPKAFSGIKLGITLLNSSFYSVVTVAVTLLLASMTAFYIAKFPKKNFLYLYFILGIMIPIQATIIPIFVNMSRMGLNNTRLGIIIIYIATNLSISIFIIAGFMRKGVPNELIEAAIIDGSGLLNTFFGIVLPISKPGIATVGIFVFLNVWNEFLFALLMLPKPALRTLNLSVYMLRGQYTSDQGLMAAGVLILVAPVILIYITFQEQVVKGLTAGAVKG